MPEKGRFAPSPSGRMHLGNLYAFLLAWLDARSVGGNVLLRIEDLDPDRTGEPWSSLLADDLRWLGLDWEEGFEAGGDRGPYRQRERADLYDEAFRGLREDGLVYPCWCSRAQRLAASAPHPGEKQDPGVCPCRSLSRAERRRRELVRAPAWKAALPREELSFTDLCRGPQSFHLAHDCGDFVVRRADGIYGYQLAVSVDDALMGVTRVIRGRDLLDSAPRQIWLMGALGYSPPAYGHIPLLLSGDGRRLSKRDGDLDMGVLRQRFRPEELVGELACLAGLRSDASPCAPAQLVEAFRIGEVGKPDILCSKLPFSPAENE